jgi:hypothetical protein
MIHRSEIPLAPGGDSWRIGSQIVGISFAETMVHPNGLSQMAGSMEMVSMEECMAFLDQGHGDVGKRSKWERCEAGVVSPNGADVIDGGNATAAESNGAKRSIIAILAVKGSDFWILE